MQRIEGSTATKDNKFTDGNLADNTPGTIVTSEFLNSMQEEIATVIESEKITLDKKIYTQLNTAIESKIKRVNNVIDSNYRSITGFYNSLKNLVDDMSKKIIAQRKAIKSETDKSTVIAEEDKITLNSKIIEINSDNLKWDKEPKELTDLVNKKYADKQKKTYMYADTVNRVEYIGNNNLKNLVKFNSYYFAYGITDNHWNDSRDTYTIEYDGNYEIDVDISGEAVDLNNGTVFELFCIFNIGKDLQEVVTLARWTIEIIDNRNKKYFAPLKRKICRELYKNQTVSIGFRLVDGFKCAISNETISSIKIELIGN
jgi:hypothetical protein